jgi:hypothetical protein
VNIQLRRAGEPGSEAAVYNKHFIRNDVAKSGESFKLSNTLCMCGLFSGI